MIVADNRPRPRGGAAGSARISAPPAWRHRGSPATARRRWPAASGSCSSTPTPPRRRGCSTSISIPRPGERTAVLAGGIIDRPGSVGVGRRMTAERGQMSQRSTLDRAGTPYAQTANCAVRRSAFAAVGGFDEAARSGEDADLCFRLAAAGWGLEERPGRWSSTRREARWRELLHSWPCTAAARPGWIAAIRANSRRRGRARWAGGRCGPGPQRCWRGCGGTGRPLRRGRSSWPRAWPSSGAAAVKPARRS